MPYKRGENSTHRGALWGQSREGCTGLRVSVLWCELCTPKADNTLMAGGRGLTELRIKARGSSFTVPFSPCL